MKTNFFVVLLFLVVFSVPQKGMAVNDIDNWKELSAGKTITIITNQHIRHGGGNNDGEVEWMRFDNGSVSRHPGMSLLSSQATKEKYPETKALRFRVYEEYAGPAQYINLPYLPASHNRISKAGLSNVPYGAKQAIYIQATDLSGSHPELISGVIAVSFEDLSLEVLRRVALEDGVLRAFRVRDNRFFIMKGDDLIKGEVPNKLLVQEAVIISIAGHDIAGRADPQSVGNSGSLGAQIGASGGGIVGAVAGAVAGGLLATFVGNSTSAYHVSYQIDGETETRTTIQGTWCKDMKSGDRVKVTRGSFYEKLEKL